MKIVNIRIKPVTKTILSNTAGVIATFDDGSIRSLFSFYPDEISFEAAELIGLTEAEALELHHLKDEAFLKLCVSQIRLRAWKPKGAAARKLQHR